MMREWTRSVPLGLIVSRRASQQSRSAVSGLIGPAPSSSGGVPSSLRCTISVVGLRLTPPSSPPGWVASVTSASAVYCCHSSTGVPLFLSAARSGLAMFQIACSNATPCSSGSEPLKRSSRLSPAPGHAQRAPPVELAVVRDLRRHEHERSTRDLAGCFADRDARELGVGLGRRDARRRRRPGRVSARRCRAPRRAPAACAARRLCA